MGGWHIPPGTEIWQVIGLSRLPTDWRKGPPICDTVCGWGSLGLRHIFLHHIAPLLRGRETLISRRGSPKSHWEYLWELPASRYPTIMVIYPYPLFGLILWWVCTLYYKNYPKLFSNYYPESTFWVIYPFLWIHKKLYTNLLSLNTTQLYKRGWKCSQCLGIVFIIETMISDRNYMEIAILNCTRGNGNVLLI